MRPLGERSVFDEIPQTSWFILLGSFDFWISFKNSSDFLGFYFCSLTIKRWRKRKTGS